MIKKAHARLGASTSDIWTNCPGAPALWDKAPEKEESSYAREGTDAHALLERVLKGIVNGKLVIPPGPADMVDAVMVAVKDFTSIWDGQSEVVIEEKVNLSEVIAPDMFGTVDYGVINHFGTLIVNDYKHGRGVKVYAYKETANGEVIANPQLAYYAIGLAAKYHFNFEDVLLRVIQPRCTQDTPISEVRISISDLLDYVEFFKNAVYETTRPKAKRRAGSWCRFCKAKPICREGQRGYKTDSKLDFDEL